MLKDVKILDYDAPDIKEDEMDKYVAHIYLDDANVTLENGENALEKAMEDAIKNNKLMVIHIFRKGFSTKSLTLGQIRDKYEQAYSLLQSDKLKNLPVLSETMQLERDVEVDPYITFDFFLKELLKNHFGHGNFGLFEYPIACYIAPDGSKMVTYDSSLDLGNGRYSSPFLSEEFKNRGITTGVLDDLMKETRIHGDGKGRKMMAESKTRNFEDSRRVDDSKIAGYRFFKATVTLKLETEEQIEAAKQYKKEQDANVKPSVTRATTTEDWEAFWSSILKPFGVKLGNYAHVWEEVVFRYLPTAFILLGYMNPLVGLGIQIMFILAHPLGKWMASRMNWEKAKKEGKQVGKKAGIGDLFKQIGKDFLLLTPTLVLMLPYVGALLSLAINPALSLIITPAIFTFADVIVKWLTKKDSGGEVSIDKKLVIFIAAISFVSYTFLPLIPVIHPIVNALINPVVITNAMNAGYLHYEYNKRQQDRSKSLSIIPRDIGTLNAILSGDIQTKRTAIANLIRDNNGNVDFDLVRKMFPDTKRREINEIYDAVMNGTANASQYSKQKKVIYFLFVFLKNSSSGLDDQNNFPDDLIQVVCSSIFDPTSSVDTGWDTCFSYMKNRIDSDKENADAVLKMFAALYAHKIWEDFKLDPRYQFMNDGTEIRFADNSTLTFKKWVHVCDGHSLFTNGIENDTWNKYYGNINVDENNYKNNAKNGIVTLDLLLDEAIMTTILTDPDIIISFSDDTRKCVKRIGDKVYSCVVSLSSSGKVKNLLTFYVKSYQNDTIDMTRVLNEELDSWDGGASYTIIAQIDSSAVIRGDDNGFNERDADYYVLRERNPGTTGTSRIFDQEALISASEIDSKINVVEKLKELFQDKARKCYGEILIEIDGVIHLDIYNFIVEIIKNPNMYADDAIFNAEIDRRLSIFTDDQLNNKRAQIKSFIKSVRENCSNMVQFLGTNKYTSLFIPQMLLFIDALARGNRTEDGKVIKGSINVYFKSVSLLVDRSCLDAMYFMRDIMAMSAILPENMGIVNRMLQQSRSAFVAATVIAFKEFRASLKPNFVDLHQSESGRKGAQQLRDFITRFDVVETDGLAIRIIKAILGTIVKGASIVKHITIDYRFIKASGITQAIKMFGSNTYLDENGNVHIPPVMIVDDLQQVQGELIPTGISVNGRSIYQVAESGMLIYGAQGISGVDVSKAINESQMIKDAIENMIRAKGYEGIKVEVEGVIQEEGEGVRFEDGITIIGTQELQGKSIEYVNGFVSSSLEIKRSMGVMYSQKALISLESMDDMEKLEQALKQGRARKIISKSQYEQLQLTPEEIITMRENGIEIYVDSNEIDSNLKENGIVGQIIRKDGQIFIHDYYVQEEVEVEEIGEEDSLLNIENKLVNSQKPILIDIKVLAKQFQKENILGVYKGLNTLIGNIKIKTGIGTINQADIENLAYNIDYNKIPDLGTLSKKKLETLTIDELIEMLNIAENSEIRIILKAIRKNQNLDENGFVNIIKERILAKAVLKENNKEFGLKDKKMEILLGKMLLKQLGNQDKQNVNIPDSFTGEKDNVIKKIMEETEKAMKGDEVAVNTIIEIILVYGDSYKNKQMAKELDANDARNYRAMMAAA